MPTNNDGDTTIRDEFIKSIQYMNDSPNTNPIPFTTGVYTHEPTTYTLPYNFVCTFNYSTIY